MFGVMPRSLPELLQQGIETLGLTVPAEAQIRLLDYVALLKKWNKVYNLTAVRQEEQMVIHHLLDSLAVLPYLWPRNWLDVGCGAGLPGLVLAIVEREWSFTLVDSNSKKTAFVQQAAIDLGLKNVRVHSGRVESFSVDETFDGIISRAFSEPAVFVEKTCHLLGAGGGWAAMKGHAEKGLLELSADVEIEKAVNLAVPGLGAARSLVVIKRKI